MYNDEKIIAVKKLMKILQAYALQKVFNLDSSILDSISHSSPFLDHLVNFEVNLCDQYLEYAGSSYYKCINFDAYMSLREPKEFYICDYFDYDSAESSLQPYLNALFPQNFTLKSDIEEKSGQELFNKSICSDIMLEEAKNSLLVVTEDCRSHISITNQIRRASVERPIDEENSQSNSEVNCDDSILPLKSNTESVEFHHVSEPVKRKLFNVTTEIRFQEIKIQRPEIPLLKNFIFQYFKRENLDKKLLRLFKKDLVKKARERSSKGLKEGLYLGEDGAFWKKLIEGKILPPTCYIEGEKKLVFRSFNVTFLAWFFNHHKVSEIYNKFILKAGGKIIDSIEPSFKGSKAKAEQEEKVLLKTYIYNLPRIIQNYIEEAHFEVERPKEVYSR